MIDFVCILSPFLRMNDLWSGTLQVGSPTHWQCPQCPKQQCSYGCAPNAVPLVPASVCTLPEMTEESSMRRGVSTLLLEKKALQCTCEKLSSVTIPGSLFPKTSSRIKRARVSVKKDIRILNYFWALMGHFERLLHYWVIINSEYLDYSPQTEDLPSP